MKWNSTCVLGSWIDNKYKIFQKIIQNKTPVVLCFDYDAQEKTQKIAKTLYEYCVPVKISQHKEKDFGDMTKKEVEFYLEQNFPNQFVPRYSMVSCHRIPYSICQKRGKIQEKILDKLCSNIKSASEINLNIAKNLINANLDQI